MTDQTPDLGELGRIYVCKAEARPRVAARVVAGIVDWLCDGSVEEVLVGMVDARMLDRGTLARLVERIGEAREQHAQAETEPAKAGMT